MNSPNLAWYPWLGLSYSKKNFSKLINEFAQVDEDISSFVEVISFEVVSFEVIPFEVISFEVIPIEVIPFEVIPIEVIPIEVKL